MKLNGQKINHKKAKKIYLYQCRWFGVAPISDYRLSRMSTREIFQAGEDMYNTFPKDLQEKFAARMRGEKPLNIIQKIKLRLFRLFGIKGKLVNV